jgi:hypothetical protein
MRKPVSRAAIDLTYEVRTGPTFTSEEHFFAGQIADALGTYSTPHDLRWLVFASLRAGEAFFLEAIPQTREALVNLVLSRLDRGLPIGGFHLDPDHHAEKCECCDHELIEEGSTWVFKEVAQSLLERKYVDLVDLVSTDSVWKHVDGLFVDTRNKVRRAQRARLQ